jgi:hypothetical protein
VKGKNPEAEAAVDEGIVSGVAAAALQAEIENGAGLEVAMAEFTVLALEKVFDQDAKMIRGIGRFGIFNPQKLKRLVYLIIFQFVLTQRRGITIKPMC